jgi:hypothetical protein
MIQPIFYFVLKNLVPRTRFFTFISCCSKKGNFPQTAENSKLKEFQLGVDKGCFFRIWDKPTAIKKPFEGFMKIRHWRWWWQIT